MKMSLYNRKQALGSEYPGSLTSMAIPASTGPALSQTKYTHAHTLHRDGYVSIVSEINITMLDAC